MALDRRRYGRQIRLVDVGEAGQARLCAAEVELATAGFARAIEARYLEGAGMRVEGEGGAPARIDVATLGLRHVHAREVGEGALSALVAIRAALGIEGAS